MGTPAQPVCVDEVADGLLLLPGINIESELRPAMLGTRARSGMVADDPTSNSGALGEGVTEGAVGECGVGTTFRHQVRSYSDSQHGVTAQSTPQAATRGLVGAATGALAFAPPTMSYIPPPVVVDAAVDGGI